jgi:hypothetical protein
MFLYYLQRLGMATGFMQILAPCDIRCGPGNELDGTQLPITGGQFED